MYVAPFVDFKSFYMEYKYYSAHHYCLPDTVKRAFEDCATRGIKKLKAKGSFNTCEICNNASLLLSNKGIDSTAVIII